MSKSYITNKQNPSY